MLPDTEERMLEVAGNVVLVLIAVFAILGLVGKLLDRQQARWEARRPWLLDAVKDALRLIDPIDSTRSPNDLAREEARYLGHLNGTWVHAQIGAPTELAKQLDGLRLVEQIRWLLEGHSDEEIVRRLEELRPGLLEARQLLDQGRPRGI